MVAVHCGGATVSAPHNIMHPATLIITSAGRRLEIWISLEEGLRAADLFADIETAMNQKFGEGTELIARVRRAKSEFVFLPSIEDNTDTSAV